MLSLYELGAGGRDMQIHAAAQLLCTGKKIELVRLHSWILFSVQQKASLLTKSWLAGISSV